MDQISKTQLNNSLTDQQLRHFNFSKLPQHQIQLLNKLSFFNGHSKLYQILSNQYGQAKNKERFIQQNINYLTANETVQFNKSIQFFKFRTFTFPAYATLICTVSSFIFALWKIPSRMSTVKYTLGGFAGGVLMSYCYWRYSMVQYYDSLNKLLRTVALERYNIQKQKKTTNL